MKATRFKDASVEFAKDQDEYQSLPALRLKDDKDTIITCYKLSFKERIRVLFTGIIWMSEMNFNRDLTPRYFSTIRKEVYLKPDEQ